MEKAEDLIDYGEIRELHWTPEESEFYNNDSCGAVSFADRLQYQQTDKAEMAVNYLYLYGWGMAGLWA